MSCGGGHVPLTTQRTTEQGNAPGDDPVQHGNDVTATVRRC